jgi:hypothetical protein
MAITGQAPLGGVSVDPQVYQSAAEARLGDQPRAAFHVTLTRKGLLSGIAYLIIGLGLIVGGVLIYGADSSSDSSGVGTLAVMSIVGLLALAGAVYCLLYGVIYKNWHVYVYEHGFIYTRGQAPKVFRWDQVEAIWFQITRRYYNGIYMGTTYKYRVRRNDGLEVILNDRFTNIAALGNLVNERITQTKLPQVIAALNAGQTVTFGPLSISQAGLQNARGALLPWQEIKGVDIQSGYIAISKAGKWLKWSNQPIANIPNALLFVSLARSVLQRR